VKGPRGRPPLAVHRRRHDPRSRNVTKAFGPKKLFEDVNVYVRARAPLTASPAPNGAGKSTFMKILSGDEDADTGRVHRPEAARHPAPGPTSDEDDRVVDVVLMGTRPCGRP